MKERLIEIIKVLKKVIEETGLNVSDNVILEQASTYHRGELAQEGRVSNYSKPKIIQPSPVSASNSTIRKPSKAQMIALRKLNKYDPNLTYEQAWKIINESKNY